MASDLGAYEALEKQSGTVGEHGLTFALLVVEAIGRPHGLEMVSERERPEGPFDAVFLSVFDVRCTVEIAPVLKRLRVPLRRAERSASHPLVWAGGQGLRNPVPMAPIADLMVLGDAEDPLPVLLTLWDRHGGDKLAFLAAAATVPGVYVPSHHDWRRDVIDWSVAEDIGASLREHLSPTLTGSRRLEIARGCPFKCRMCGLGWRTTYRENPTEQLVQIIKRNTGSVLHLQAGDAESHSGIDEIRRALRHADCQDQGWTGRLDTIGLEGKIDSTKRYAFGVEGASERMRALVGKAYLTDKMLAEGTSAVFDAIRVDRGGDTRGRIMWHLIAGLPGERRSEAQDLIRVIRTIDQRKTRQKVPRNLTIHWQPFQPLPGTPMQWAATGHGCQAWARLLKPAERFPYARVIQHTGRTDEMARWCTVLCRADERGAEALARKFTSAQAAEVCGVGWGELDADQPMPWDMVRAWVSPDGLRRVWRTTQRKIAEGG